MSLWSYLTNHDIIIPWHSTMFHRNYLLGLFGDICIRHIYSVYKPTCILYIPQFNLYLRCLTTTMLQTLNSSNQLLAIPYQGTLASFHFVLSLCCFRLWALRACRLAVNVCSITITAVDYEPSETRSCIASQIVLSFYCCFHCIPYYRCILVGPLGQPFCLGFHSLLLCLYPG